jgi:hypothetical protein
MMTRCIGKDPKMIIDLSKDNKLQLMGFDNLLVTSKLQQVNMSNQTTVMQPGDLGGFVNGTKNDATNASASNTGATMGNNNQRSPSALTSTTVRRIPNQPTMMNRFLNNQSRRR